MPESGLREMQASAQRGNRRCPFGRGGKCEPGSRLAHRGARPKHNRPASPSVCHRTRNWKVQTATSRYYRLGL